MSLKCSIFGHRFGEPSVERDRDESGSEVVSTIRETQTCERCGTERVVSENKEVTTLETPDEDGETDDDDPDVPDEVDDLAAVNAGGDAGSTAPEDAYDAETDDATIIEDSPEESIVEEAEPDESGESAVAETAGQTTEPETAAGSSPAEEDAVILDDEAEEPAEETSEAREPGAWPEEPGDDEPDWEPSTDIGGEAPTEDASPDVEPAADAVTVPQGSFRCQECGFTTSVEASSLREGDFCPDCHTGTLEHDPDAA